MAVGAFGMSWGLQIGASHADVMIVFMKPSALQPFCSAEGTDLHLGPESGIAVGPMGRRAGMSHGLAHLASDNPDVGVLTTPLQTPMIESLDQLQSESLEGHMDRTEQVRAEVAQRAGEVKPAYTYSHCKGLFVGVSLEGSVLTVRPEVNEAFYQQRHVEVGPVLEGALERPLHLVKAKALYKQLRLLTGTVPPPLLAAAGISPYTKPAQPLPRPAAPPASAGAWAPPRDKWGSGGGGGGAAATPSPGGGGGWVPPRDKWSGGPTTRGNSNKAPPAPAAGAANPFVEAGAHPFSDPAAASSSRQQQQQQPQQGSAASGQVKSPPPSGEVFAIGGDDDEGVVEFSV